MKLDDLMMITSKCDRIPREMCMSLNVHDML